MANNDSTTVTPLNGTPTPSSVLVEIKKGKIVFKQKPMAFDKLSETMQEIVQFRTLLSDLLEKKASPLAAIPDEHLPVVAKLVHESDKTGPALIKQLQKQLVPADDSLEADSASSLAAACLPAAVIETSVSNIATRVNYGLDTPVSGGKVPAAWNVWRWEVKPERRDFLPKAIRDKTEARILERVQAKKDLIALFDALSQDAKNEIMKVKGPAPAKQALKDTANHVASASVSNPVLVSPVKDMPPAKDVPKSIVGDSENAPEEPNSTSPAKSRQRPKDQETELKEKEREERKAAREEKERKAHEAHNKSKALMANFFGKPKNAAASGSGVMPTPPLASALTSSKASTSATATSTANPQLNKRDSKPRIRHQENEFCRTFRPFVVKKDAELAPVNHFLRARRRKSNMPPGKGKAKEDADTGDNNEVIVISEDESRMDEDEDIVMQSTPSTPANLASLSARDRLQTLLKPLRSMKSIHQALPSEESIRSMMSQLSEAEVTGDAAVVRSYLDRLSDRTQFPAKVFIFDEDSRPGYFGTRSKSSTVIRPRKPFVQDAVVLDYSYDSGEEWEGEEEGAGDEVAGDDDDEEGEGAVEDEDSDADSWLVDDDEVEMPDLDRMSPISDVSLTGMSLNLPPEPTLPKRKVDVVGKEDKADQKKRKVVPLVPFIKGPCWESEVGVCEYVPFETYRIQLFNDTPYGIDPFTFVSTAVQDMKAAKQQVDSAGSEFAVPVLPDHVHDSSAPPVLGSTSGDTSVDMSSLHPNAALSTGAKRAPLKPKSAFPEALVPALLAKIDALNTGSIILIVESAYQDMKAQKGVKKNSLEAKIREVSEKSQKVWTVKPDMRARYT